MNAPFTYSSPTLSVEALKHSIAYKLMFTIGKDPVVANKHEWLNATLLCDHLVERWLRQTVPSCRKKLVRFTTCRWSFDWPYAFNAMLSLGIYEDVQGTGSDGII
ncbi:MAG: hypothetical protein ACLT78_06345 [Escherichia coli]